MAIEDAVAVADLLQEVGEDYATAFQRLQRARFLRTARVQLESRALWEVYHCSGLDAELRAAQWGERGAEDFYRCLDWLWTPSP
jgi:salicylate hydroxylase